MTTEQDADGLRRAFEALSSDAAFTQDCPPSERIWAGARGELLPADVEKLAEHLAGCGACAAAWRTAMDFGPAATGVRPIGGLSTVTRWVLPLAAIIVLSVGGYIAYDLLTETQAEPVGQVARGNDVPLPRQPMLPLDPAPIRVPAEYALVWRGSGTGKEFLTQFAAALEPYRAANYDEAITRFTKLAGRHPGLPEPFFYLGVSQLLAGRTEDAITTFERVRAQAPGELAADADWYQAVAEERAGRVAGARQRLAALCNRGGPAAGRACAGLRTLGEP